jgi:hypothetical protein
MHRLFQPWLCYISLVSLAAFSFISGCALEIGVRSSVVAVRHHFGKQPIPTPTQWFFGLHAEQTHSLLTLSFYPTIIATSYLFFLRRRTWNVHEQCARFAIVALAAFTATAAFLVLGGLSLALPFLPIPGGLLAIPAPATPLLQRAVWIGFVLLLVVSATLFIALVTSLRRHPDVPAPARLQP